MDQLVAREPAPIETPSGKGAADENFPVASFLLPARLRPHVMRFYDFARAADDVADDTELSAQEKIRRLDQFEEALDGAYDLPVANRLRESLAATSVPDRHARDLLVAFRMDATKQRYEDWEALLHYCRYSANPVGRYLMDLHGESPALHPASDALCTVLQILNHLQDCQCDWQNLDRVYLPQDWLAEQGVKISDLGGASSKPGLRRLLDRALDRCDALIEAARARPARPQSRRLHAEMVVITRLAALLAARLRAEDPLAGRVALSRPDFLRATLIGIVALGNSRRG